MDEHLSREDAMRSDTKATPRTPRLSRPITALAIRPDIVDEDIAAQRPAITIMPRLDQHQHSHPYISAKAQDLLYGGQKHEHAKIYDKLGMSAKEYATFKSAGKALLAMGAGHSGLSPAHSHAERIVHDELTESARNRQVAAAEKARKRNAALALTHASKKAQELLNGKRDKVTDRLGISRNEINQFKTMNKAYQRLGIYDATSVNVLPVPIRPTIRPQSKQADKTNTSLIPASSSPLQSLTIDRSNKCDAAEQKEQTTNVDHLDLPQPSSPTHSAVSDIISIGQLSPASFVRSNSTFSSIPLPAPILASPVNASPVRSARGSRRIVLQPIASRTIVPRVRSGLRDASTTALPGSVNSRSPVSQQQSGASQNAPPSRTTQQAWKKKAKMIGRVATTLKPSPQRAANSSSSNPIDPVYPLLSSASRPSIPSTTSVTRASPLSPVPSTKHKTLTASQSWKKVDSMVKAQRAVKSFQPKSVTSTKR